jgi:outer membrane lipoprotein-sorting protein
METATATLLIYLAGMALPSWELDQLHRVPVRHPLAVPMRSKESCLQVAERERARSNKASCQAVGVDFPRSKDMAGITLDAQQKGIIDKVSSYFSAIHTLQGSFLQTGSDNRRMKGKFYLSRPGRFRFDYARPSRQIVVSDGQYLAVQDLDLHNEDQVDLVRTPFRLVLSSDVNLVRDAKIMEVEESDDRIAIALHDKSPDVAGQLTLYLTTKPELELKAFVTRDAVGGDTRVEVSDLVKGVQLDADLFKIAPVGWKE